MQKMYQNASVTVFGKEKLPIFRKLDEPSEIPLSAEPEKDNVESKEFNLLDPFGIFGVILETSTAMLKINTGHQRMVSETLRVVEAELKKVKTPMENFSRIALTAPPKETAEIMKISREKAEEDSITIFESMLECSKFYNKKLWEALSTGSEAFGNFADDFAEATYNIGEGLRNEQAKYEPEYGFKNTPKELFSETPRGNVYKITATPDAEGLIDIPRESAKPMLIVFPDVLSPDIGALSEKMNMSTTFAKYFPVYVITRKDITTNKAVQEMGVNELTEDTAEISAQIEKKHGMPVTISSICMGSTLSMFSLASGKVTSADVFESIVGPKGGKSMFSEGLEKLKELPNYNNTEMFQKRLPNGNFVIDGDALAGSIAAPNENVKPTLAQLFDNLCDTHKKVEDGTHEFREGDVLTKTYIEDTRDVPVKLTNATFALASQGVSEDGTIPVEVDDKLLSIYNLPIHVNEIRNRTGRYDPVTTFENSNGPMIKHLSKQLETDHIKNTVAKTGHLGFAKKAEKHAKPIIDSQAKSTRQYKLWDQLEKEVGYDFLHQHCLESSDIICPQTLPDTTIDLLIITLENLETKNTTERANNIKFLKAQKTWNMLVRELGKEFLEKEDITCEVVTGRMSLHPDTINKLSQKLVEVEENDNSEQINNCIKTLSSMMEEIN